MRAVAAVVAGKMSKIDGEKKKGKRERETDSVHIAEVHAYEIMPWRI